MVGERSEKTITFPLAQHYREVYHVPDKNSFIHDPGMIKMPDGKLLVFSPCWKKSGEDTYDCTVKVSQSSDGGINWNVIATLPYCEATPFLYDGVLYLYTEFRQHDGVYVTCSHDGGYTWEKEVQVSEKGYWNCQTSMVIGDDKLYWCMDEEHLRLAAVCCDLKKGVMNPEAWRFSEPLTLPTIPDCINRHVNPIPHSEWHGGWKNEFGVLESNVIEVRDRLIVLSRIVVDEYSTTNMGAWLEIEDKDELRLIFRQYHPIPGGQCKFNIVYDQISDMFFMASNLPTNSNDWLGYKGAWIENGCSGGTGNERRILTLWYSLDGLNWIPAGIIAMFQNPRRSFMYPSMVIDGEDLLILSRTSVHAPNQHDADYTTFHRITGFRKLAFDIRPSFDEVIEGV